MFLRKSSKTFQSYSGILIFLTSLILKLSQDCSAARSSTKICINNCAQCKRTFGSFFEGQKCAESCIKFRGMMIPDCNDASTISSFLNKLE